MYILGADHLTDTIAEMRSRWKTYQDYLQSIKEKIPQAVYEYATADWHYDVGLHDPRCPHDAWVEAVAITEASTRANKQDRVLQIEARLLDPFHRGHIFFRYKNVVSFSMSAPNVKDSMLPSTPNRGHNDLIIDEIRLSDSGTIIHEVEFALGAHWLINAESFEHDWKPNHE